MSSESKHSGRELCMWTLSSSSRIPSRFHGRRESRVLQPTRRLPTHLFLAPKPGRRLEGLGAVTMPRWILLNPDAAAGLPEEGFKGSTVATSRAMRFSAILVAHWSTPLPKRPDPGGQRLQLRPRFASRLLVLIDRCREDCSLCIHYRVFPSKRSCQTRTMDIISPGGPSSGPWRKQLNSSSVVWDVERHLYNPYSTSSNPRFALPLFLGQNTWISTTTLDTTSST